MLYVIAENLNASDPVVHAALAAGDRRWIEERARALVARGCDAIDVNAGTFGRSESDVLVWLAEVVEAVAELPLAIDSADASIVARAGLHRRQPPILNSIDVDSFVGADVPAAFEREGARLVVQLRRATTLPRTLDDRLLWTDAVLAAAAVRSIDVDRLLLDAVMLPWGDDLEAGRDLLDFVAEAHRRWPDLRTLVGLSNVSYGHSDAPRLHALWLDRLAHDGLGAALFDVLDPTCVAIARRGGGPRDRRAGA